jgi:hypothetical protein
MYLFSIVLLLFVACQHSTEKAKSETSSSANQEINLKQRNTYSVGL